MHQPHKSAQRGQNVERDRRGEEGSKRMRQRQAVTGGGRSSFTRLPCLQNLNHTARNSTGHNPEAAAGVQGGPLVCAAYQGLCLLLRPPVRLEGSDEGLHAVPGLLRDGPQLGTRVVHGIQQALQVLEVGRRGRGRTRWSEVEGGGERRQMNRWWGCQLCFPDTQTHSSTHTRSHSITFEAHSKHARSHPITLKHAQAYSSTHTRAHSSEHTPAHLSTVPGLDAAPCPLLTFSFTVPVAFSLSCRAMSARWDLSEGGCLLRAAAAPDPTAGAPPFFLR
jgi:hypothetical protein